MSNDCVHVVFGTGPIGLAIMEALLDKGKQVRVVNSRGKAYVPFQVEVKGGDAMDPAFAINASEGASVIYNALNPPYDKWDILFPPLQISLIDAATVTGAKLVSVENTYMYGNVHGQPMTEDMPYDPHTRKGKVRAQMAEDLLAAHERGQIRAVIGRASDYFGPGATASSMIGARVVWPALAGKKARLLFEPDQPHTYTYVPDIGRAMVILGEDDRALGRTWHIPSPETLTTREIINRIYKEAGHMPQISVMNGWLFKALQYVMPVMRELGEMMYEFEEPFYVDHTRFMETFGDQMQPTPMDVAIKETVDWFRKNPKR